MNGKKANYLKLRRGVFEEKHMKVLKGETFRVFAYLTSAANQKREPVKVAEVGKKQLARKLGVSVNTISRAVATLTKHGYIESHPRGFFIKKLFNGSDTDTPDETGGVSNGHPPDQIVTPPVSESDTPPDQILTPPGSLSDTLFGASDSELKTSPLRTKGRSMDKEGRSRNSNRDPDGVGRRYLMVLSGVTKRKFRTLTPDVKKKIKARLKDWTPEEIIAAPIAIWATHDKSRLVGHGSDVYLRDGESPRTRNGQTYGGYYWMARAYDRADGVELDPELTSFAKQMGVDGTLEMKGFTLCGGVDP